MFVSVRPEWILPTRQQRVPLILSRTALFKDCAALIAHFGHSIFPKIWLTSDEHSRYIWLYHMLVGLGHGKPARLVCLYVGRVELAPSDTVNDR